MTLGQKLRQARLERGLTQKQLVGDQITRNMLSKIENDSATPSMRTLEFLARQLNLPVSYFLSDFSLSDGTSPDGLDRMRQAYQQERYQDCIDLLEQSKTAGSTDEGYLLHALACIGAAKQSLAAGNVNEAKENADAADYYNKQGMYYSAAVDAEMSLILAECALLLDLSEFEKNAEEYERAVKSIQFSQRYRLARAEYLVRRNRMQEAEALLEAGQSDSPALSGRARYIRGLALLQQKLPAQALPLLQEADGALAGTAYEKPVCQALEQCCLALEDYKGAYEYAARQLRR